MMEEKETNSLITEENIAGMMNFGLSEEEARVYLSLLRRGPRGEVVGRIKDELSIGRTTIYAIMEHLTKKNWVSAKEVSEKPRRIKYVANPPYKTLNRLISEKQDQLKRMKQSSLYLGDNLEIAYQGAKKLSLDTIHPGAYKYLLPLITQGFKLKSEVIEHFGIGGPRISYDYELKGPKGFPRDCGLIIFEYEEQVEGNDHLIKEAADMFKEKTIYEIRRENIPGFEDIKLEETKFGEHFGTNVYIKLKIKKNWWMSGHQAVIPLKNKIFMIFGSPKNFEILMKIMSESEEFHHLV